MKEQIAPHTYKRRAEAWVFPVNTPLPPLPEKRKGEREHQPAQEAASQKHRVVTTPKADPVVAWNTFSERRGQLQRERGRPPKYTAVVLRAHAQMNMRHAHGRIEPWKQRQAVPDRSGRLATRSLLRWRLLSLFALAAALLLAISFATSSNAFRIEQVSVVGTHNPVLIDAIQRMGMQGQNIFLLDVDATLERINASPLVASVSLDKQWPNQLTVTVVERKPVLLWQTTKGTYGVDGQGMVIAEASQMTGIDRLNMVIDAESRPAGQPGNAGYPLHPGSHLNQADISFAMKVFTRLPIVTGITNFQLLYGGTMYISRADSEAGPSGSGSFIVESPAGWVAYLGGAGDTNPLENRLIELQQILALAQQHHLPLATVDLRYGLYSVYTLNQ